MNGDDLRRLRDSSEPGDLTSQERRRLQWLTLKDLQEFLSVEWPRYQLRRARFEERINERVGFNTWLVRGLVLVVAVAAFRALGV